MTCSQGTHEPDGQNKEVDFQKHLEVYWQSKDGRCTDSGRMVPEASLRRQEATSADDVAYRTTGDPSHDVGTHYRGAAKR